MLADEYRLKVFRKSFEVNYKPHIVAPVRSGSSWIGMYSGSVNEFVVDKLIACDLDGTLTPEDVSFASNYIFYVCSRLGISDSDAREMLKKLAMASRTFDATLGESAVKPLYNAGLTRALHDDGCDYSAKNTPIIPGTIDFFREMLKMGYFKVIDTMSPQELADTVSELRLENPKGFSIGTILYFDDNLKFNGHAEFNFSPRKRVYVDRLKKLYGYDAETFEIVMSNDPTDIKRLRAGFWFPAIFFGKSKNGFEGLTFEYPEGRENMYLLAQKIRQVEAQIISEKLGNNQRHLNQLTKEIWQMSAKLKTETDNSLFKQFQKSVSTYLAYKQHVSSEISAAEIKRTMGHLWISGNNIERSELVDEILEELRANNFEFNLAERELEELS